MDIYVNIDETIFLAIQRKTKAREKQNATIKNNLRETFSEDST
jgi:hypothetical protein